jgi:beta-mannanase
MNGFWYRWGTKQTTPAEFVAAWRHIHNLFTRAGATNVIWVWNPNDIYPVPQVQLKPYYPGDAYVDWIGITGYFATTGPHNYADLYAPTVTEVRSFTTKPFIIAETSVQTGQAEVACARQLILRTVAQHPDVLGFIWFDYNKNGVDWRVESRPILRAAVVKDVARLRLLNVQRR